MTLYVQKPFTYAGRRLKAGDPFEAKKPRDAKVLQAVGKVGPQAYGTRMMVAAEPAKTETIAEVREQYARVIGRRPFNGWDIETLRAKIAAGPED